MARWHTCNILKPGADARQLWQFEAAKADFKLARTQAIPAAASLSTNATSKTWRSLWQPRLNVAWLPPGSVFLRVVHLPKASCTETVAMVELQLEKLSPIPVNQLVWSAHLLEDSNAPVPAESTEADAKPAESLQTTILVLAERRAVEEILGQLEVAGYFADRLEIPILDQVIATKAEGDGAWIYPVTGEAGNTAIVAWWYGGVLRNLNFLALPAPGADATLRDQLDQMTWAGELEGWLTSPPRWTLVADDATAGLWLAPMQEATGDALALGEPLDENALAALTARRAVVADPKVNLLPAEHLTRYQQAFVDRLWMRGVFGLFGLYMVGVLIYFVWLGVQNWRVARLENEIQTLGLSYTNTIRLSEKHRVLKERSDLKFTALECWRAVAELMPETARLDSLNFSDGKRLTLRGTAPKADIQKVTDFSSELRKAQSGDKGLFGTGGDPFNWQGAGANSEEVTWSFSLELKFAEAK
jgi:hypothetical protein